MKDYKLPSAYIQDMKLLLKDDYDDFISSYNEKNHKAVSVNTKKLSRDDLKKIIGNNYEDVPWSDSGIYTDSDDMMSKNPMYHTGAYYIQEPSAMAPANYLDVQKGMKVLDMCASPGGKTFQISQKLSDEDLLISNDINTNRILPLLRNIEYHGLRNVMITNENQENLSKNFSSFFDRILLDAPCSGEGMFRKDKKLIPSYERSRKETIEIQKDLLEKAALMLKVGGKLLYSTCTFNTEENEKNILNFLSKHSEFELISIPKKNGMMSFDFLKESARFFPHKTKSEGHFLCLMCKKSETEKNIFEETDLKRESYIDSKYEKKKYLDRKKLPKEYIEFEKKFLNCKLEGNFFMQNNSLYIEIFDKILKYKIRIARNGLYLGDLKNNEFVISSALIRYLKSKDFQYTINFGLNDERVIKYIKGETLIIDGIKDGDYIVCLEDYPIGLVRAKNSKLKNMYNKNWRIM
ncbi:hypothetical protein HMPREF9629_02060 [Peptoanaerobacter stomatis]|uniref:SAM-dependent MTase RsmB/NOP-type domain-containing protein n=1 Tax=Peptoanaerobacter stomatis TaxID=796937 RepID=G9X0X4_9FIRM|nr:RsmB/NOP family class I SAM-dependent RNA methyltransferase [Peptoanaerobacter stomatis]EHL14948.1 hypothetical protein HMPREF9629_02060 [Peptoanaerobacter stomatis]